MVSLMAVMPGLVRLVRTYYPLGSSGLFQLLLFMSVLLIFFQTGYGRTGLVSPGGRPVPPLVNISTRNSGTPGLVSF
jgi:hypothetical protein